MGVDTGKVSAFKAFDFDGKEEWNAHLRNVELPAGNPEAALLKVKSKWYKKTVDPDFDPAWLTGSTPSSQQQSSMPQQELLLTPGRQPVLMLMVWQVLRLRYWSVDAAIHHRQVWQALDQLTAGFRYRFPILQKPVNMGVAFFQSARQ